jgi:hypothetical protein
MADTDTKTEPKAAAKKGGNELVAQGAVAPDGEPVTVSASADMPPDEPGHKGAEINAGDTPFDPNAARRYEEGRRPGMQDSERLQPAHWVQPLDPTVELEQKVEDAKAALEAAEDELAEAKKA